MKRIIIKQILTVSIIITMLSGILLHVMRDSMWLMLLHAVASIIFCIACVFHVLIYKKRECKKLDI